MRDNGGVSDPTIVLLRDMMVKAQGRVKDLVAAGKSLDDIQKAKPLADLDATWAKGFITPDVFLKELYMDLSRGK